jgi:hypothetical protein
MAKEPDLDSILKTNPSIDPKKIKDQLALLDKLDEMGISRENSKIISPSDRRRIRAEDGKAQRNEVQLRSMLS